MLWSHVPNLGIVSCTQNRTQNEIGRCLLRPLHYLWHGRQLGSAPSCRGLAADGRYRCRYRLVAIGYAQDTLCFCGFIPEMFCLWFDRLCDQNSAKYGSVLDSLCRHIDMAASRGWQRLLGHQLHSQLPGRAIRPCLERQVAQNNRPSCPKVAHNSWKVAQIINYSSP